MTRDAIIGAIQRGLKRGPLPPDQKAMLTARLAAHARHLIPARGNLDRAGRISLFSEYVEREFGTVARLASLADVPGAITSYLARQNLAPALVASPHPDLQKIPFDTAPLLKIRFGLCSPTDAVSLQHAFAGIAETGTLMLPAAPERPTTINLLGDTAIVVLRSSRVVGAYEEAWDLLRAERIDAATGGFMPRNVMFVTGPSRSADIESTLELGAHGPRRLHVVLIDD